MDEVDLRIVQLLEENGRISHEEISKLLHISRPAVHQRVAKLEKNGVIKGYRAIIDWRKVEQKLKVLIFVKARCQNFKEIAEKIVNVQVPNVTIIECQRLAGEWCMMLKVRATAPEDITNLIDEMVTYDEVQETSTTFILSSIYEDGCRDI